MIVNIYVAFLAGLLFVVILPILFFVILKNESKLLKFCAIIYMVCYFVLLFVGVTSTINFDKSSVIINLAFDGEWFSPNFVLFGGGIVNSLINLVMFFPLGLLVYSFSKKKKFLKTILLALILSIIIETLQWILPISRNTELLDVLLNTISGVISALTFKFLTTTLFKNIQNENS